MIQPRLALIRAKYNRVITFLRIKYLQALGLQVGNRTDLAKLVCTWPKSVKIGSDCTIQGNVRFHVAHPFSIENCIEVGDRVFIGQNCELICVSKIIVGNDTMIASNTTIVDVGHAIDPSKLINKQPILSKEIIIGEDVWIGTACIILKGVTIGKGSVIGAGSVVNKSIPEYEVWAGSPARFIRKRD